MRRLRSSVLIALLAVILISSTAFAGYPFGAKIIAAQQYWVGYANVWGNTDGSLDIKLDMGSGSIQGWCMTDAAIHVATSLTDIPQNAGGAIPGQFAYKFDFGGCIEEMYPIHIPKGSWSYGQPLYIAIHVNTYDPQGVQETAWTVYCGQIGAAQFPGRNWSAYFIFPADAWY